MKKTDHIHEALNGQELITVLRFEICVSLSVTRLGTSELRITVELEARKLII